MNAVDLAIQPTVWPWCIVSFLPPSLPSAIHPSFSLCPPPPHPSPLSPSPHLPHLCPPPPPTYLPSATHPLFPPLCPPTPPPSPLPPLPSPSGSFLPSSDSYAPELSVYKVQCQLVMLMEKFPGQLEVTTKNINFVPDQSEVKESLCEYCCVSHYTLGLYKATDSFKPVAVC